MSIGRQTDQGDSFNGPRKAFSMININQRYREEVVTYLRDLNLPEAKVSSVVTEYDVIVTFQATSMDHAIQSQQKMQECPHITHILTVFEMRPEELP